jgi:tetratricopeptide (TPR) repeat protein
MNLASVLDDTGRTDEAITEYKEALLIEPKNANIHYNLSIAYQKKHDLASAIAELKHAAELSPDWPQPHIMLTNLLKDSDPATALRECLAADGLTHDAKLHDRCLELQKKGP